MIKSTKGIVSLSAIIFTVCVILAVNIVLGFYTTVITRLLFGFGNNFDSDEFQIAMQESDALAQEIAGEGIVMLQNKNNALPLEETEKKLNIFGWGATDGGFVLSGSGSGEADGNKRKLLLGALEEKGYEYNDKLIEIGENFQRNRSGSSLTSNSNLFFRLYEPAITSYTHDIMQDALIFSETAVIVISRLGGEGKDLPTVQYKKTTGSSYTTDNSKTYLQISDEEELLISLVANAGFKKVILLLNTCNIMQLDFLDSYNIDSVLSVGALGQTGALAIGDIFSGKINPSGKTVDTWLRNLKADPTYVNAGEAGVSSYTNASSVRYIDYVEDIYVGYKYFETAAEEKYINYKDVVMYPFGYGMSYTEFEWEIESISPSEGSALSKDGKVEVKVLVENTGDVAGQDVVQLYFTPPYTSGKIEKPHVQLAAFAKTAKLEPGDVQRLTLSFDVYDMASYDCYDANGNGFAGYELDAGTYYVKLQTDAHTLSECDGAKITYKVDSPGIRYEKDPVTGYDVKNLFTGASADAGVSIDGKDSGANIKYLSRANFAETFPSVKASARAQGRSAVSTIYGYDTVITNTMPTQGASGNLMLTTGSGANREINEELIMELGSDFKNSKWDALLNQITESELNRIVEDGGYQTAAIASIGKPLAYDFDGPSGLNTNNASIDKTSWTSFPVQTVIASTWNVLESYSFGLAVGAEAAASGVAGWYAPAVNLHRSAFEGRNFEYYSEDTLLSGIMGAETTRGALTNGLYCYVKHFAVNETETHRGGLRTWLTEQAMRELYLRPFEITVKKGDANAIMTAFNYIGPVWAGGSKPLLTTILRDEWGFKGSVVTDYSDGGGDWMNIAQGLRAGNDLWLTGAYPSGVPNHQGKTTPSGVYLMRMAAKNILYTYCNTYYYAKTTDADINRFTAEVGLKMVDEQFPYWWFGVIGFDVVALGGVGVWLFFLLRKKPVAKA